MCTPLEWMPATKGLRGATRATSAAFSVFAFIREIERQKWKERQTERKKDKQV